MPRAVASAALDYTVKRLANDARRLSLGVADLTGLENILAGETDIGCGWLRGRGLAPPHVVGASEKDIPIWNVFFCSSTLALRGNLPAFLRRIVFIGETAFRLRFKFERIRLNAIRGLDQIVVRALCLVEPSRALRHVVDVQQETVPIRNGFWAAEVSFPRGTILFCGCPTDFPTLLRRHQRSVRERCLVERRRAKRPRGEIVPARAAALRLLAFPFGALFAVCFIAKPPPR
jgi:hypothetical protein